MPLFTADLFRNFVLGFVVGGVLVAAANASQFEAPAKAASPVEAPAIGEEFVIGTFGE